ncbi:unnamed protein product [Moneuplotes crassus]|uniref:Uncharacterized protein n=1 Tax=Euplotes crassus TaxID=5936 RepID=A0AAD1Y253_EUPCR|nr:unnamed protein product [Moneuplotes crassus]
MNLEMNEIIEANYCEHGEEYSFKNSQSNAVIESCGCPFDECKHQPTGCLELEDMPKPQYKSNYISKDEHADNEYEGGCESLLSSTYKFFLQKGIALKLSLTLSESSNSSLECETRKRVYNPSFITNS